MHHILHIFHMDSVGCTANQVFVSTGWHKSCLGLSMLAFLEIIAFFTSLFLRKTAKACYGLEACDNY